MFWAMEIIPIFFEEYQTFKRIRCLWLVPKFFVQTKRGMHFQVSVFRFSAWKFNEDRGQFYYHAFTPEQPDLNYRNPMVVEEMKVSKNSVGHSLWVWRRFNVSEPELIVTKRGFWNVVVIEIVADFFLSLYPLKY